MKKPEKISLTIIALVAASLGMLAYVASLVAYYVFIFNMNFESLVNPAANPVFSFATEGFMVAFVIAAVAFLLTVLAVIQENKRPEHQSIRSNKALVNAIVLSVAVLIATISSGVTPLYNPHKTKTETPTPMVTQLLKDDVDVKFGAYDAKSGTIPVTVTNKRPVATDYIIIIDAFDKSGYRLAEDSIYTTGMKAHGTEGYKIFNTSYTKVTPAQLETATFKISDITKVDRIQGN